eukprot:366082-Chlamydomonas_euryale.AAC.3
MNEWRDGSHTCSSSSVTGCLPCSEPMGSPAHMSSTFASSWLEGGSWLSRMLSRRTSANGIALFAAPPAAAVVGARLTSWTSRLWVSATRSGSGTDCGSERANGRKGRQRQVANTQCCVWKCGRMMRLGMHVGRGSGLWLCHILAVRILLKHVSI